MNNKKKKFYTIVNWKMHFSIDQAEDFLHHLSSLIQRDYEELVIAPLMPYLLYLMRKFPDINFASQDLSEIQCEQGAYTGECGAHLMAQSGVRYAIVGHSERRFKMRETNEITLEKLNAALEFNIQPILCVSEPTEVRSCGKYLAYVIEQINYFLDEMKRKRGGLSDHLIIAYEPYCFIGNKCTLPIDRISEDLYLLNKHLSNALDNYELIYGGSVNPSNISDIRGISFISGVLIGSSGLEVDSLLSILQKTVARLDVCM
ncbi:Triosephosphate isomerase [Rickettsiales endosymbiont of Paramecium tredecaurelia]|uniref:triose-phosphate isomerase n=1 Tax=Candidatus Sarmatiella mevalonica TaxID=2770581 RepID=UPI0019204837|nr:triose-phosphate isomerase family protein [Candidatus Sarmatiella mevalonica]MBL3284445.1 Triosephosphate isomerase [Candidatus Sarmatiella mevalonica]